MFLKEQERYYKLGQDYWWLAGKYDIVESIIGFLIKDNLLKQNNGLVILDAGCGPGNMLDRLSKFGVVFGSDLSFHALSFCRGRGYHKLFISELQNCPLASESFDIVVAVDVIEHIDAHECACREVHRILKPGGLFVLTVPAFMFLWGEHDELYFHKRRYRVKQLRKILENIGFSVKKLSYIEMIFFLPLLFFRRLKRFLSNQKREDFVSLPEVLNYILRNIIAIDGFFLKYINFPVGATIVCVAQKPRLVPMAIPLALRTKVG